jgi:hypothetical protein
MERSAMKSFLQQLFERPQQVMPGATNEATQRLTAALEVLPPGRALILECGRGEFVIMHRDDMEHIAERAGLKSNTIGPRTKIDGL